jgi:hypothetical protein
MDISLRMDVPLGDVIVGGVCWNILLFCLVRDFEQVEEIFPEMM